MFRFRADSLGIIEASTAWFWETTILLSFPFAPPSAQTGGKIPSPPENEEDVDHHEGPSVKLN